MKFHEALPEDTPARDVYARAAQAEQNGDTERARYHEKLADHFMKQTAERTSPRHRGIDG